MTDATDDSGTDSYRGGQERLWSPWRMRYVGGENTETGCIFCNRLAAEDDRRSLILHRDDDAFIIMNLYPYNTGHSMIVTRQHTASPEDADPAAIAAISRLRRPLLRASRRALRCQGFNLGMNIGAVAGAGIAEHLHEHVVPRWAGDANFMPILANTTVMPELVPVTYAKLRAELVREHTDTVEAGCVVLAVQGTLVLVDADGWSPRVSLPPGEPVWRVALDKLRRLSGSEVELHGWAGPSPAGDATITLDFHVDPSAESPPPPKLGWHWMMLTEAAPASPDPLIATAYRDRLMEPPPSP